ncbi:MAG: hypothetical protein ACRD68_05385 [Pyrinomonadaceae bacterium]
MPWFSIPSYGNLVCVRLTDYWPFQSGLSKAEKKMEGGIHDRRDNLLYPLEDYLEGKAPYVSLACDYTGGKPGNRSEFKIYGYRVRLPAVESKMGVSFIDFRLVDTGGRFYGKKKKILLAGHEPIDVCRRSKPEGEASLDGMSVSLVLYGHP